MYEHIPKVWNGITLVYSRAHRFASYSKNKTVLSGTGMDIVRRLCDNVKSPIENCCAFVLGESERIPKNFINDAQYVIGQGDACALAFHGRSLDLCRGLMKIENGRRTIVTYNIQDACDPYQGIEDIIHFVEEDEGTDNDNNKDFSRTSAKNFRGWVLRDLNKLINWKEGLNIANDQMRLITPDDGCNELSLVKDIIYIDIETDPVTNRLECIGFAVDERPPVVLFPYSLSGQLQPNARRFFATLAKVQASVRSVYHNANFDVMYLQDECGIPPQPNLADTMVMHHRCFPELEKSLGHCMSHLHNVQFHKDTSGTFAPVNQMQRMTLARYNGKDVDGTRVIYKALLRHAETDPLLYESVQQANESVFVCMAIGYRGIPFNWTKKQDAIKLSQAKIAQLQRVLNILVGYHLNYRSSKQLIQYLFTEMGYKPKGQTESGKPSTDRLSLLKLRREHADNVALAVILEMASEARATIDFKDVTRL